MNVSGRLAQGVIVAAMIALSACTHDATCVEPPTAPVAPVALPSLITPASGATDVSTGPLDVTIRNATGVFSLFVKDGSGNVTTATNLRPSNPPATDVRTGTLAQLASQTVYQVYANVLGPGPTTFQCRPNAQNIASQIVLLGSFTTR